MSIVTQPAPLHRLIRRTGERGENVLDGSSSSQSVGPDKTDTDERLEIIYIANVTNGANALHGKYNRREKQWHACDRSDPRARSDIR